MKNYRPRVAFLVETSIKYGRDILSGINEYLSAEGNWSVYVDQSQLFDLPAEEIFADSWDGMILRNITPEIKEKLIKLKIPVIDLDDNHETDVFHRIVSDHFGIGVMGAEHLLERGFKKFGFLSFNEKWSHERCQGFTETLTQNGYKCSVFESPWRGDEVRNWTQEQNEILKWLKSLSMPVAVMACNDIRALHLINICNVHGISIPEDVCILGVDNDEIFCEISTPPLSSICPNAKAVGMRAARLLDRLMKGDKVEISTELVEPARVFSRRSTDVLAIEDEVMRAALNYISENACYGCTVSDVARELLVSRSLLERRFRKFLNTSPQTEIRKVQIKQAKKLLLETEFPLTRISQLTGFEYPEYFNVVFKRMTGTTPGGFRKSEK